MTFTVILGTIISVIWTIIAMAGAIAIVGILGGLCLMLFRYLEG